MRIRHIKDPDVNRPIIIAAMQDMGNVGSITIDFLKKSLKATPFRYICSNYPNYVLDRGGYIEFSQQRWDYSYGKNMILFGGGYGQPQSNEEMFYLCKDVISVAKKCSAQLIYTCGAFHSERDFGKYPKTFATTNSEVLTEQITRLGISKTERPSYITGFNGSILGFAKVNGIKAIGLYGEIKDPQIPQYRAAKSIIQVLERLTYQKVEGLDELDIMGEAIDKEMDKMKRADADNNSAEEK
ncbi:MAG TPA: PAC2 family protein [Nitrososphaeraceae archaeon]|nr:PAC2 family protein [Nitrososphaeraceae archaeon]